MSLVKEYFELTKKYQDEYGENTILLMQVGAFFEVYGIHHKETQTITGSKIQSFSQICELNIVEKNTCVAENGVVMSGFKDLQIERYIKKIQDAGFTVVVYAQDENAKHTTRSLAGIFSPGTYFHTESSHLSNSTTCIWVDYIENKIILKGKYVVVGIANIDIYTGKTTIFQFKELYVNNPTTYDELERFISVYNPSEVILISNLPEKEMDNIVSYAGISCGLVHKINVNNTSLTNAKSTNVKNCEKMIYQKEILSKFYNVGHFNLFIQAFQEHNIATQSLCYLLDFMYQHNPQLVHKISEPVFETTSKRLSLANHSLKQLNIINDGNVKPTKYSCVSEMLNNCLTPMGKRTFLYNMLHPVCDKELLHREYDITEHMLKNMSHFNKELKHRLMQIKDLSKIERQIFLKKISPKSICNFYSNLNTILEIFNVVVDDPVLVQYLKVTDDAILNIGNKLKSLICCLNEQIDVELAKDIDKEQYFDVNFIRVGVDDELDANTQLLTVSQLKLDKIREFLNSLMESSEKKANDYVKLHETEKNNVGLISTARRCKVLDAILPKEDTSVMLTIFNNQKEEHFSLKYSKSQFSYEKQSASNHYIIHPYIQQVCEDISQVKSSMKEQIAKVYNKIVDNFGVHQKEIERIIQFVTLVDVVYTKASIAKQFNYCKPEIVETDKSFVNATNLRHCLIEQFNTNEFYITNDVSLGNHSVDGILLFGTNAVGKTTLIRALGISIILAQAGLYVPCSRFEFNPYKRIFTRIIGNDNIFKGLSTFEVEMSELRTILRLMDENSLILGDELCSGTETVSATSIFVAGIQQLHKAKSSFIFATHLHEIVDYEEIHEMETVHLKHMEVTYNKETESLVYNRKLKDGSGANVYGLEVCKSLHLPIEFLQQANHIRMKYNKDTKSMLSLKQSRYNSQKIVGKCEQCGKPATEVHHIYHQSTADNEGVIRISDSIFHKNSLANLMSLCEDCHKNMH